MSTFLMTCAAGQWCMDSNSREMETAELYNGDRYITNRKGQMTLDVTVVIQMRHKTGPFKVEDAYGNDSPVGRGSSTCPQRFPVMDNLDHALPSDIAVIGMACRFPGSASSPSKFWDLLLRPTSAYGEVPHDRYNPQGFYHAGGKLNTLNSQGGHFLDEDLAGFDASFFKIPPQQASVMDPSARKLLEVTYEALEDAGLPKETLAGTDTACYVGSLPTDYHEMLRRDPEACPRYTATGIGPSLLSGHISHFFDFHGASMTLDTACASGLVAVHQACQNLRTGGSRLAVVGAANLIFSPDFSMSLSNLGLLATDGRSKPFTDDADGYGRGEGVAAIVLKPLAAAWADGDAVRAVIRSSVVGHNGGQGAITTPQVDAQSRLIASAYASSGLRYGDTGFVEAHGTGTAVGDRTELTALGQTVGHGQLPGQQLLVGSVKAVIGHGESVAGLAGLIKCVLMLEHEVVIPHFRDGRRDTTLPLERWNLILPTVPVAWPPRDVVRASVNSFGYSGTNAHVVLDRRPSPPRRPHTAGDAASVLESPRHTRYLLFLFSAHDAHSLETMKKRYKDHVDLIRARLGAESEIDEAEYLARLSYTLNERRSRLSCQTYVVASSLLELASGLVSPRPSSMAAGRATTPPVLFVFTGQGAQWRRMGWELLRYPVVRDSVDQASRYLKETLDCAWSLHEEWSRAGEDSNIHRAYVSQPLTTVIQVAMVDLLRSWGVHPTAVVGHSSGEIAAAYGCGAITREEAWTISYWRGRLCTTLSSEGADHPGSMMAVALPAETVQSHLASCASGGLWVACHNSPSSVTVSGHQAKIEALEASLRAKGVFCRTLKVENAYHSPQMEPIAAPYRAKLRLGKKTPVKPTPESIIFVSSVTGEVMDPSQLTVDYWVRNLISPVLFSRAIPSLLEALRLRPSNHGSPDPAALWVEIGPHGALRGPVTEMMRAREVSDFGYTSTLSRGVDATRSMLDCVGFLALHGVPISLPKVDGSRGKLRPHHDLPPYPWNHTRRFWTESRHSRNYRFRQHGAHDFLGTPSTDSIDGQPSWRLFIRPEDNPWIRDHVVGSKMVYPRGAILAMMIEALRRLAKRDHDAQCFVLEQVHFLASIEVPEGDKGVEVTLRLQALDDAPSRWRLTLTSHSPQGEAESIASGLGSMIRRAAVDADLGGDHTRRSRQWENARGGLSPRAFYDSVRSAGYHYGPLFQGLTHIRRRKGRAECALAIPSVKMAMPRQVQSAHLIHPVTLEVILQSLWVASGADAVRARESHLLPVSLARLAISDDLSSDASATLLGDCVTRTDQVSFVRGDLCFWDPARPESSISIEGIRCERRLRPGGAGEGSEGLGPETEGRTQEALVDFIAGELGIPAAQMDHHVPMVDHGVDSLLAPKISRWIERRTRLRLALSEILEASLSDLLRVDPGSGGSVAIDEDDDRRAAMGRRLWGGLGHFTCAIRPSSLPDR